MVNWFSTKVPRQFILQRIIVFSTNDAVTIKYSYAKKKEKFLPIIIHKNQLKMCYKPK